MSRWIDADALEYDTEWSEYHDGFTAYSQMAIDTAPSIDVEPKRGEWIDQDQGAYYPMECSVCHSEPLCDEYGYRLTNYCPTCGARMKGADDE